MASTCLRAPPPAHPAVRERVARWRPTAEIGSTGTIQATCRADGVASAWAVGTIQPKDVVAECQADGIASAQVELEPLPGECRADGVAQAWCVGYVRSFAQADGEASAAVSWFSRKWNEAGFC